MKPFISRILRDRTISWFLIIFVLAFGLRLARAMIDDNMDKDSVIYLWMAEAAASGDINGAVAYNQRMPPLYVAIMAAGEHAGVGAYNTGIIVSLVAGTLLLLPVFWIARMLANDKIALFAALIVATHPYLVRISAEVMRDSLFLLLVFAGFAFAVAAAREISPFRWILPGIFAGLAVMTRTEGVELIVAALIWSVLEIYLAGRAGGIRPALKKAAFSCLLVVASFLMVTMPVQILLSSSQSSWGPVDERVAGYFREFKDQSKNEVKEMEKR